MGDTWTRAMIFAELVRIENEIATFTSAGLGLLGSSEWNIDPFRERIVALKQQLKAYAKSGCVDLGRKAPASAERAWLLAIECVHKDQILVSMYLSVAATKSHMNRMCFRRSSRLTACAPVCPATGRSDRWAISPRLFATVLRWDFARAGS